MTGTGWAFHSHIPVDLLSEDVICRSGGCVSGLFQGWETTSAQLSGLSSRCLQNDIIPPGTQTRFLHSVNHIFEETRWKLFFNSNTSASSSVTDQHEMLSLHYVCNITRVCGALTAFGLDWSGLKWVCNQTWNQKHNRQPDIMWHAHTDGV